MKERVYVETSVISYLAARKAANTLIRHRQEITRIWWERKENWDCRISLAVLEEIGQGDEEAARRRIAIAELLPVIQSSPEARELSSALIRARVIPPNQELDALHLALAVTHDCRFLLTWNQKHLDNVRVRMKCEQIIKNSGFAPVIILSPDRLLEEKYG